MGGGWSDQVCLCVCEREKKKKVRILQKGEREMSFYCKEEVIKFSREMASNLPLRQLTSLQVHPHIPLRKMRNLKFIFLSLKSTILQLFHCRYDTPPHFPI